MDSPDPERVKVGGVLFSCGFDRRLAPAARERPPTTENRPDGTAAVDGSAVTSAPSGGQPYHTAAVGRTAAVASASVAVVAVGGGD